MPPRPRCRPGTWGYLLDWARSAGYRSIQFDAVVETNSAAVHLWQVLGFRILATIPEAFDHPEYGLVGLHVMFQRLAAGAAADTTSARPPSN